MSRGTVVSSPARCRAAAAVARGYPEASRRVAHCDSECGAASGGRPPPDCGLDRASGSNVKICRGTRVLSCNVLCLPARLHFVISVPIAASDLFARQSQRPTV
jgi:hypothetical protein